MLPSDLSQPHASVSRNIHFVHIPLLQRLAVLPIFIRGRWLHSWSANPPTSACSLACDRHSCFCGTCPQVNRRSRRGVWLLYRANSCYWFSIKATHAPCLQTVFSCIQRRSRCSAVRSLPVAHPAANATPPPLYYWPPTSLFSVRIIGLLRAHSDTETEIGPRTHPSLPRAGLPSDTQCDKDAFDKWGGFVCFLALLIHLKLPTRDVRFRICRTVSPAPTSPWQILASISI
ncbi:uncharacterized protein B0H18DRAFT_458404 [Fomitopsis serialis]|uniref:uncharacterized protein n=1 Tax=Fomitopsis serialis TaxID=139415 RepID=UPI002007ABA2|nr:uncharacterized protein B0H18DRAFT_458404 [Neoantrodia serialis]KAH9923645.1 hypothetical protein B0H18DRAFT_458404 [Neoantrodia serialis]